MSRARRLRRRARTRERRLRERVATALREAVQAVKPALAAQSLPATWANYGWCSTVAELARVRLCAWGIVALVVRDDGTLCVSDHEVYRDTPWTHDWLWVEGKHHDAEALYGVRRWLDLPHFVRWTRPRPVAPGLDPWWDVGGEPVRIEPVMSPGEEREQLAQNVAITRELWRHVEAAAARGPWLREGELVRG